MPAGLNELDATPAAPFDGEALLSFLGKRAVSGLETYERQADRITFRRTLRLDHGPAVLRLDWVHGRLRVRCDLSDEQDRGPAIERVGRLLDLDADSAVIDAHLVRDPSLQDSVRAHPGLRVPGAVDAAELAVRTLIGQQISLAGAANCVGKIVARFGSELPVAVGGLTHLFPTSEQLAAADPETLPMPRARGRVLVTLAAALATGALDLTGDRPLAELRRDLLALPGIGPWTADYLLMRVRHAPDVLLDTDLVIRRELVARGITDSTAWAPYRSYATMHLWRNYVV